MFSIYTIASIYHSELFLTKIVYAKLLKLKFFLENIVPKLFIQGRIVHAQKVISMCIDITVPW